jgi:hypothetical protein
MTRVGVRVQTWWVDERRWNRLWLSQGRGSGTGYVPEVELSVRDAIYAKAAMRDRL